MSSDRPRIRVELGCPSVPTPTRSSEPSITSIRLHCHVQSYIYDHLTLQTDLKPASHHTPTTVDGHGRHHRTVSAAEAQPGRFGRRRDRGHCWRGTRLVPTRCRRHRRRRCGMRRRNQQRRYYYSSRGRTRRRRSWKSRTTGRRLMRCERSVSSTSTRRTTAAAARQQVYLRQIKSPSMWRSRWGVRGLSWPVVKTPSTRR